MICAVINFSCSRFALDWSGMDSGQLLSASNTNATRNLLYRIYKNLRKIFEDKHIISFQDKQSFGVQNVDMTPIYEFFTSAVIKKARNGLDNTSDVTVIDKGSGSKSDKHCINRTSRRACSKVVQEARQVLFQAVKVTIITVVLSPRLVTSIRFLFGLIHISVN